MIKKIFQKKSTVKLAAGAVVLIIAAAVIVNQINASQENISQANLTVGTKQTAVKVISAKTAPLESSASFNASLEASQEGMVSSKIGGKVIEILFENGQAVKQGQALARLDDTDLKNNIKTSQAQMAAVKSQLNSTQISLQKVQANLDATQRSYDRAKALYEEQIITRVDFENAETALTAAKADLASTKAGIEAQQANLQTSETSLEILQDSLKNTTITAPIDGVIKGKSANLGQYIGAGTVLGTVADMSPVYAVIEVSESDLSYVKQGEKASFQLSGSNSETYSGSVEIISGTADPASRRFQCKIKLENPKGALKPGVFGNVKFASNTDKKAIALPIQALGGTEGNYFVFINQQGVAKNRR